MNTPLLVVIAYHKGDLDITRALLHWIKDLGSCKPHSLLLAADNTVPREIIRELMSIVRPTFENVRTMIVPVPDGGWPPNAMFMNAARQVETNYKLPFLWLEPDCIPLCESWLLQLANAYAICPKRFMGPIVTQEENPALPKEHLTGCSVYPNDAYSLLVEIESIKTGKSAWDIAGAPVVIPKAANTDLIHHFWGSKDMPPVFLPAIVPGSPKNHVGLSFVNPGAVLFHRSKDGGLIKLLREKSGLKREQEQTIIPPAPEPTSPKAGEDVPKPPAAPAQEAAKRTPAAPVGAKPAQFTAPLQPAGKVS